MAYYYVKVGGTAAAATDNGRYASQQTGSFETIGESGYYDNLHDAFAASTVPTHGDFVCISDASTTKSHATNAILSAPTTEGAGVFVLSVSDTACQTYSVGAKESTELAIEYYFNGQIAVAGIHFATRSYTSFASDGCTAIAYECTFEALSVNSYAVAFHGDGSAVSLINCTITKTSTGADANQWSGVNFCRTEFINCTFTNNGSGADAHFYISQPGGPHVLIDGCEFIANGTNDWIIGSGSHDSTVFDDGYTFEFRNCKLGSGITVFETGNEPVKSSYNVIMTNPADTSAGAEYQYYFANGEGTVEDETGKYRDDSTAYPSGQKASLKVISSSTASPAVPLYFDFPTRYAELSNTASDTIRIYLTCASTLNNDDVYAELIYSDGTNKHTPNNVKSIGGHMIPGDFRVTTPVALTTSTETWTGGLTNKYQIDLDTSTDPGADCVPIIRVYVAAASTTIYFCTSVDVL